MCIECIHKVHMYIECTQEVQSMCIECIHEECIHEIQQIIPASLYIIMT